MDVSSLPTLVNSAIFDIFVVLSLMEMEKRSRVRSFSYHRQTRQAEQLDVTNLSGPDKHLVSLSCSTAHGKIRSSCRQNTESPRWPFKSFGLAHFFAENIQQTSVPTTIWQLPWPCCVFWQNGFKAQNFCAWKHFVVLFDIWCQDHSLLSNLAAYFCSAFVAVRVHIETLWASLDACHQHFNPVGQGISVICVCGCFCREETCMMHYVLYGGCSGLQMMAFSLHPTLNQLHSLSQQRARFCFELVSSVPVPDPNVVTVPQWQRM